MAVRVGTDRAGVHGEADHPAVRDEAGRAAAGGAVQGESPGGREDGQRGTMASTRAGAPEPRLIFIGATMTLKPRTGRRFRLSRFST